MAVTWDCIASFGSDTSWSTAGNWPTGGVPLAGEDALIPTITNAIAGSDQSAADLGTVWFGPDCTKQVGSSGTTLQLATNLLAIEGTGEKWIKASGNGIDYVFINMADPSQTVYLYPNTTNKITNVYVQQGRCIVAAEAGAITFGDVLGRNGYLEISASSGGFTTLRNAGTVKSLELVTTLHNLPGGIFTQDLSATDTVTNAYLSAGSTFNFDYAGTIAFLEAADNAVADFNRNKQNKTVTTSILSPGAEIRAGAHVALTALVGEV